MVLAISFLETPLKFRAPGITPPLGLGIGRLVFRAPNTVEVVLAAVLATQTVLLRPRLDRRAQQITTGQPPPPSRLHPTYIGLERLTVAALIALGATLAASKVHGGQMRSDTGDRADSIHGAEVGVVAGQRRGREVRQFADIDLRTGGTRSRVECVQHPAVVIGDHTAPPPMTGGPFAGTVAVHRGVIAPRRRY